MGDFTGFKFGNVHSYDDLGITRVSSGDRYDEELFPEIKDLTAEVPGLDGEYYFGSTYGPRSFQIDFAFDSLTELQFRKLRTTFGTRDIKKLVFDERPYKYYLAKIENPIELSFVCFDEPNYTWEKIQLAQNTYAQGISGDFEYKAYDGTTRRIYKGEGSVTFVCYFPFAKSAYKELPVDEAESDWVISSGILSATAYAEFDTYNTTTGVIKVYNAGDLPTGFRLYCPFTAASSLKLTYTSGSGNTAQLNINQITPQINGTGANDIGILVNTDNGLIQGVQTFGIDNSGNSTYTTSGNLYNSYIDSGYFFKLEPSISQEDGATITITDASDNIISTNGIKIFYDYLYF